MASSEGASSSSEEEDPLLGELVPGRSPVWPPIPDKLDEACDLFHAHRGDGSRAALARMASDVEGGKEALSDLDDLQTSCMLLIADAIVRNVPGYGKSCVVAGGLPLKAFLRTRMRAGEEGKGGGPDPIVRARLAAASHHGALASDIDVFVVDTVESVPESSRDQLDKFPSRVMREIGEVLSEYLELELMYDWTESVDACELHPDVFVHGPYGTIPGRHRAHWPHGPHAAAARECDGMEVLDFPLESPGKSEARSALRRLAGHLPAAAAARSTITHVFDYVVSGQSLQPCSEMNGIYRVATFPVTINIIVLDPSIGDAANAICQFDLTPTMVAFGPAPARPKEFSYLFGSGLTLQHIETGRMDFTPCAFQPTTEKGRFSIWQGARPGDRPAIRAACLRAAAGEEEEEDGEGESGMRTKGSSAGPAVEMRSVTAGTLVQIKRQVARVEKYERRGWELVPGGRSWRAEDKDRIFGGPPLPRYHLRLMGLMRAAGMLLVWEKRAKEAYWSPARKRERGEFQRDLEELIAPRPSPAGP
mmetsp:Transcript_22855/g.71077  ORF Transcript_22855/g.71077 Transcript_22855/m.71077 type:complete len:534 (-) Transcript_22855:381-1982(-)